MHALGCIVVRKTSYKYSTAGYPENDASPSIIEMLKE
jgi:hypothetical protein